MLWKGWGCLVQMTVRSPSSPRWGRCHLLRNGSEMGMKVPLVPLRPESFHTPIRRWTPKVFQQHTEAEAWAAWLSVHLRLKISCLSSEMFYEAALMNAEPSQSFSLVLLPAGYPHRKTILSQGPPLHLCSSAYLSVSSIFSWASTLLQLLLLLQSCNLAFFYALPLFHRPIHSFPPSLFFSFHISLALSVSLSLPIAEGVHELRMRHPHWSAI